MRCRDSTEELRVIIDRRSRPRGGDPEGPGLDASARRTDRPRVLLAHPSAQLYGADRMALESASAFVQAGWDVLVVLDSDGPLRPELEAVGARVAIVPMPVLRKGLMSAGGVLRFAVQMVRGTGRLARALRGFRPELLYVNTVTIPLWLLLGRAVRCHVVCHVHEAEAGLARVVRVALTAPLALAHLVIANSGVTKDLLLGDLPRLGDRVVVVHNGVPGPSTWTPPRPVLREPVRLVLIGRITPRKGTEVAIQALAHLRRRGTTAELTLVGGSFAGNEAFERELHELVEGLGLAGSVHRVGELPSVWESLRSADIALVPSRVESFGNSAVEAMLACRPVVVADIQGLREIVLDRGLGEGARAGDAAELAEAVLRVTDQWTVHVERAMAARLHASECFSPDRYRRELVATVQASRAGSRGLRRRAVGVRA